MGNNDFNPLIFLASLGAGGVAVAPFILMQYTVAHGPGLITREQLWSGVAGLLPSIYYSSLELAMAAFVLIHFSLTIYFGYRLAKWLRTPQFTELAGDPLRNASLVAPIISLLMTMNLFIGPIRYFVPALSQNFQALFAPAFAFWSLIFAISMLAEIWLLGVSFKKGFDISKISFGWLLHPFLLGMLTVVGTGLAAMSQDAAIADASAFMSLISGSMGGFLLIVKLVVLFKSHMEARGLPEANFLPSFLIVLPIITLFSISAFRFGHYLARFHGFHSEAYFFAVVGVAFAFEIWYLLFGLWLLTDYFKKHHFKAFYLSQWGLVCPFVAFASLAAFAYEAVSPSPVFYGLSLVALAISALVFAELLAKYLRCASGRHGSVVCGG
jgi:hypothetical protein